MPSLDFWYEFASTYSYPAVMRIAPLAEDVGVTVNWRPFLLGPIFANHGWADSPFNLYPTKGRYMWRDLERICEAEDLPLTLPPVAFPQNGLKAARIARAGKEDGWTPDFTRAVFTANFVEKKCISMDHVLAEILEKLGLDAEAVMAESCTDLNKAHLRADTDEACRLGIFGAPSFTIGEELFWGNDRLEEALRWAVKRG
ncbi:2-hydroxychromene-2-carboxylate isomerase [Methyloligella halotolerans]|uniref:2-hydroxychromene-2-carboxylate isomerase n=1 Tax=Methyloligella halotolerans TaxID=1177755 RepID=A0A1E2S0T3_9HYPH|nr:2-hydroxychromene-2-carboxylate isomerase [Methyloligella halotolerans]ODA68074.1 2-hydroxychromene-2-carboxylate isomerase [Methyloligella halotolerans]